MFDDRVIEELQAQLPSCLRDGEDTPITVDLFADLSRKELLDAIEVMGLIRARAREIWVNGLTELATRQARRSGWC